MGVIIPENENINKKEVKGDKNKSDAELMGKLLEKVVAWVSEARPTTRIVVMTEDELVEWAKSEGIYETTALPK